MTDQHTLDNVIGELQSLHQTTEVSILTYKLRGCLVKTVFNSKLNTDYPYSTCVADTSSQQKQPPPTNSTDLLPG